MIDHEKRPRHPSAWQMNGETLYPHSVMMAVLKRDVAAAVAAEREACAKIADARWNPDNVTMTACAASIAAEIRSRQFDSK